MAHDPYQEKLDDPNLPFELRWSLINEIDSTNHRFGIYKKLIKDWDRWALKCTNDLQKFSILDVGSGSGGLSLEMRKWAENRNLIPELHLYDAQADVLNESLKKFGDNKPHIHIATQDHLKIYPDCAFDFVISLHVIHHIQPFDVAVSALQEMLRISKKGIFIVDLENKLFAVPFAKAWNSLTGVTAQLSEDGIKSIKRSHPARMLKEKLCQTEHAKLYDIQLKREFFIPYWTLRGCRKGL